MPYKNLPESEWGKMDSCVSKVMEKQPDLEKPNAIAICYSTITGKEYSADPSVEKVGNQYRVFDANSGATYKQVDSAREAVLLLDEYKATADINNLPDSAFLHVESGGEKDDTGRTVPRTLRHFPYKTESGAIDLPKLRNALSRLGQSNTGTAGGDKWLSESLRKELQSKAQGILEKNTDAESAQSKSKAMGGLVKPGMNYIIGREGNETFIPSDGTPIKDSGLLDRVLSFFKEGRRNSNTDAGRLQQIHDLSVENGAQCPMVMKQANGSYRWILLSSNSYQDRDGEIVSQKAQEADVERLNQSGNFGPLRLWHLGYPDVAAKEAGPGVDVGVCDYSQMFGRIRVESGTFTDNRVGAAIKARSDQWAGSIGFFHPLDQPDRAGVYQDSFTFERSLLPRQFASNPLTPLAAILKEQEMTTKEEKLKQLSDLLGDSALANTVLKQAEATEKAAQERGLKYKATEAAATTEAPKKDEAPAEGSAAEEAQEPKAEADAEGDTTDYEAMAKGLAPHIMPMIVKAIEEKMAGATKERTDKEASITAQIAVVDAALKETRKIVDALNSDLPKGVKKFLASESADTVAPDGKYKNLEAPQPNPLDAVYSWLTQPMATPPAVQASPEK